jgi:hypothetical protein
MRAGREHTGEFQKRLLGIAAKRAFVPLIFLLANRCLSFSLQLPLRRPSTDIPLLRRLLSLIPTLTNPRHMRTGLALAGRSDCTGRSRATMRAMPFDGVWICRVDAHIDAALPTALEQIGNH